MPQPGLSRQELDSHHQLKGPAMANRLTTTLAAMALLGAGTAVAHEGHMTSLPEAKALAAQQKKLLVLDFFSEH
jgi:hypothetical protein